VAYVLQNEGYRVTTAGNGALALEQVAREPVSILLSGPVGGVVGSLGVTSRRTRTAT